MKGDRLRPKLFRPEPPWWNGKQLFSTSVVLDSAATPMGVQAGEEFPRIPATLHGPHRERESVAPRMARHLFAWLFVAAGLII